MRNNRLAVLLLALLLSGFVLSLLWPKPATIPPPAITLRYTKLLRLSSVGPDSWRSDTFWATNHTGKPVMIILREVEILSNGTWTSYSPVAPPGLLYFTNGNRREGLLAPHAAGFGSLLAQRAILPTNAIWRVKASASPKLNGVEDIPEAVVKTAGLIEARQKTGNTNIPVNPFRKDVTLLGHSSEVVSEAVSCPQVNSKAR